MSPLQIYEDARAQEKHADAEQRRTREGIYDRARERYREACVLGHSPACDAHRRLDAVLGERRGECDSPSSCAEQGVAWLPDWRGEQRLNRLCVGRRVKVEYGESPPAFEPDGSSCVQLGDFYRERGRTEDASVHYSAGCDGAGYAVACRREGERVLAQGRAFDSAANVPGRGAALRSAVSPLQRGCELEDVDSCALLGRVGRARHRLELPNDRALRLSVGKGGPKAVLELARSGSARACELGSQPACAAVVEIDAELARITELIESGCAFLANCTAKQLCNIATGRCEGADSKGEFFAAYELGMRRFDEKKLSEARAAFELARDMVPTAAGPWRWLGIVAVRQQRYGDCVAAVEEALRLNPRSKHARALEQTLEECRSRATK